MPKKFSFSSSDVLVANRWLERKLSIKRCDSRESVFSNHNDLEAAQKAFSAINTFDGVLLLKFCEKHLTASAFSKLKGTLRAARKRQRALSVCGDKKRSIDLDFWAHTVLAGVAKSKGVTLSQLVVERFEKEYLSLSSQLTHPEA